MKRRLCMLGFALTAAAALSAQIRQYVPIVKPMMHEKTKEFLIRFGDFFIARGEKDAGNYFKAWANSGFGSGVLWVDPSTGENFVITNRHVVSYGKTATLQFEQEDDSILTVENCPILAISEKLDLALIGFPDGSKNIFTEGFDFVDSTIQDGDEVWTAGFPGLLSKPSWQLGKGIISNNRIGIEELADPQLFKLYQHTAQIDPGSSGGPLLVKDPKYSGGFGVAAINTWKFNRRQDANFSIPIKYIVDFINEYKASLLIDKQISFEERISKFSITTSNSDNSYKKLAKFISYQFVDNFGEQLYNYALKNAPETIAKELIVSFIVDPVEGMRLASAWILQTTLLKYSIFKTDISSAVFQDNTCTLNISLDEENSSMIWIIEHGIWRLSSFSLIEKYKISSKPPETSSTKPSNASSTKTSKASPPTPPPAPSLSIASGAGSSLNGSFSAYGEIIITSPILNFLTTIISFSYFKFTATIEIWDSYNYEYNEEVANIELLVPCIGGGLQIPISIGDTLLRPFATFQFGYPKYLSGMADTSTIHSSAVISYGFDLYFPKIKFGLTMQARNFTDIFCPSIFSGTCINLGLKLGF